MLLPVELVTFGECGAEARSELDPQPSTRPAARMPHAWLIVAQGKPSATLDIIGKGTFC